MLGINDGACFKSWFVQLHEKVEIGFPVFPHISAEELDLCLFNFFSIFFISDALLNFFCVAVKLRWCETLVCFNIR